MDPPPGFENGSDPLFGQSNIKNTSISELVSELRDSFLMSDFDRVEVVLVAREAKLNQEIEKKKREIGSLQEKIEVERLRRVRAELENEKRVQQRCGEISVKREKCEIDDSDAVVIAELRNKICELEKEKEKEKNKWVGDRYAIARLLAENRRLVEEKRVAESSVESWKRKFDELNEQFLNGNWIGNAAGGGNNEGKFEVPFGGNVGKKMMEIDVGSAGLKRNEDVHLFTRKSPSIASKDGPRASGEELGTATDTKDSDKETCKTKDKKETNGHPSSIAVLQKNLAAGLAEPDGILKRKIPSLHEFGRKINFNLLDQLDDVDSDTSSSGSDTSGSLDMDSLPSSYLASSKKMRTEVDSLRLNSSSR